MVLQRLGIIIIKDKKEWYLQSETYKIWQIVGVGITHNFKRTYHYADAIYPKKLNYGTLEPEINLKYYFYANYGIRFQERCESGFPQQVKYY